MTLDSSFWGADFLVIYFYPETLSETGTHPGEHPLMALSDSGVIQGQSESGFHKGVVDISPDETVSKGIKSGRLNPRLQEVFSDAVYAFYFSECSDEATARAIEEEVKLLNSKEFYLVNASVTDHTELLDLTRDSESFGLLRSAHDECYLAALETENTSSTIVHQALSVVKAEKPHDVTIVYQNPKANSGGKVSVFWEPSAPSVNNTEVRARDDNSPTEENGK